MCQNSLMSGLDAHGKIRGISLIIILNLHSLLKNITLFLTNEHDMNTMKTKIDGIVFRQAMRTGSVTESRQTGVILIKCHLGQ